MDILVLILKKKKKEAIFMLQHPQYLRTVYTEQSFDTTLSMDYAPPPFVRELITSKLNIYILYSLVCK